MEGMTPEFQKRQTPVAGLIVAASVVAAGALISLVKKVAGKRKKTADPVPAPKPASPSPVAPATPA